MATFSRQLFTTLLALCIFSGCSFRYEKAIDEEPVLGESADALSFQTGKSRSGYASIQKQVLNNKCVNCHSGKHEPFLGNYVAVKRNLSTIRDSVFVKKTMPKNSSLTKREAGLLLSWLDSGAPELPPAGAEPVPEPELPLPKGRPVRWSVLKKEIFEPKCFQCHEGANPDGKVDLTELTKVREVVGPILYTTLSTKDNEMAMPPPPAELTPQEKEMIGNWAIDGMLE